MLFGMVPQSSCLVRLLGQGNSSINASHPLVPALCSHPVQAGGGAAEQVGAEVFSSHASAAGSPVGHGSGGRSSNSCLAGQVQGNHSPAPRSPILSSCGRNVRNVSEVDSEARRVSIYSLIPKFRLLTWLVFAVAFCQQDWGHIQCCSWSTLGSSMWNQSW